LKGYQPRRKAATYTGQDELGENTEYVHASRIPTHDSSVRASGDISCLRMHGRYNRLRTFPNLFIQQSTAVYQTHSKITEVTYP
jgi:hypothetical protein